MADEESTHDMATRTAQLGAEPLPIHAPQTAHERGWLIDRYVVVDVLGAGGMGIVYKAYDPDLGRLIAIKLLRVKTTNTRAAERLKREARAIARLAHPNVVHVYDVGEVDGEVFVAMEFIEGRGLGEWLTARRRTSADVLEVFRQAACGLAAAHDAGLVHRDFKPDNVLVGYDGRVRVADFGLARHGFDEEDSAPDLGSPATGQSEGSKLTRTGALVGTPRYMAPEQHAGEPVDARADQFAFSVALYEALTGERAFSGRDYAALAASVVGGSHRPFHVDANVPQWLQNLVSRGLSRIADHRFASMHDVLHELDRDREAVRRATLDGSSTTEPMVAAFPPPDDPELVRTLDELRTTLETGWKHKAMGEYGIALGVAEQLVVDAGRIDYLPLRAAATYLLGNLQHRTGASTTARDTLYAAAEIAARAGDEWQISNVWVFLVAVLGELGRYDEAAGIARVARISLARVGENASLRSRLHHNLGASLSAQELHTEAAEQYQASVELDERTRGPDHVFLAFPLLRLGETQLALGDVESARSSLERALNLADDGSSPPRPVLGHCRRALGELLLAEERSSEASLELERSLVIWERLSGRDHDIALALCTLARCKMFDGNGEAAAALVQRAVSLCELTAPGPRLAAELEHLKRICAG